MTTATPGDGTEHSPPHTAHHEWVRAAIRDCLGLDDDGGTITITRAKLAEVAEVARRATLNWVVQGARAGFVEHHEQPEHPDD
jgi:hypothetical protein